MYYYGYSGGQTPGYASPCGPQSTYVGTTQGYGLGAALWIVLFILLVIIIGAGWSWSGNKDHHGQC